MNHNLCISIAIAVLFAVQGTMSLEFVSRDEWNAQPPKSVQYINKTLSYVIIHHSDAPAFCGTTEKCIQAMQSMQRYHQNVHGWADIGYRLDSWNII